MTKKLLVVLGIVVVLYLVAVLICNIKHAQNTNEIHGMNPCGSCWALDLLGDK